MDIHLRGALEVYRDITIKLIEELEKDQYDSLESLLYQRQIQIDKIDIIEHTKEEFTELCKEFEILLLQEKLTKLINIKRSQVRAELDSFNKGKNANISYRNRGSIDSFYFNKKI